MARLATVDPKQATGETKRLLDAVQTKLGLVPNMMRTMAQSPAVLEGYLNFSAALSRGTLSAPLREQIALAVGETNQCQYCVSAHWAIGKMVGLHEDRLAASRTATADDPKAAAALRFARMLTTERGQVTDDDVARIRSAGYADQEIAEIIATVALNIFTNYFNHVAQTEVDFPKIELLHSTAAACGGS